MPLFTNNFLQILIECLQLQPILANQNEETGKNLNLNNRMLVLLNNFTEKVLRKGKWTGQF